MWILTASRSKIHSPDKGLFTTFPKITRGTWKYEWTQEHIYKDSKDDNNQRN